jgi:hypothetical protein
MYTTAHIHLRIHIGMTTMNGTTGTDMPATMVETFTGQAGTGSLVIHITAVTH